MTTKQVMILTFKIHTVSYITTAEAHVNTNNVFLRIGQWFYNVNLELISLGCEV